MLRQGRDTGCLVGAISLSIAILMVITKLTETRMADKLVTRFTIGIRLTVNFLLTAVTLV